MDSWRALRWPSGDAIVPAPATDSAAMSSSVLKPEPDSATEEGPIVNIKPDSGGLHHWRIGRKVLACCLLVAVPALVVVIGALGKVFEILPGDVGVWLLLGGIVGLVIGALICRRIAYAIVEPLERLTRETS